MTGISIRKPTSVNTATIGIETNAGWAIAIASSKFIHYLLIKTTFNIFNQILENWFSAFKNWFEELYDS